MQSCVQYIANYISTIGTYNGFASAMTHVYMGMHNTLIYAVV